MKERMNECSLRGFISMGVMIHSDNVAGFKGAGQPREPAAGLVKINIIRYVENAFS